MKGRALPGGYSPTFYLAFLSCFLFFSSLHLLITPLPTYIEALGGGPVQVGLAGTSFAISALILRPFMGRLADTRGRKISLLIGTAVFTVGPLCYAVTTTLPAFDLARAFHGIGIAAFSTAYFALIADVTPPARWGEALGLAGIAASLSVVFASPVGTALLEHTSHRLVFLASSLTALASFVVALTIRESRPAVVTAQSLDSSGEGLLDVIKLRGVIVPSLVTLALGLTYGAVYSFLPLFARARNLGNVGFFFTGLSLSMVASRSMGGRVSDRIGRLPVVLPMCGLLALSLAGLNWTYTFGALMVMAVFHGLGFGGTRVVVDTMVVDSAPVRLRGRALSVAYFCFDTGLAASGLLVGPILDLAGYGMAFLLVGGVCVLALILFAAAMRRAETV
jgi:MFS family permease